jgi:hypothetical protein
MQRKLEAIAAELAQFKEVCIAVLIKLTLKSTQNTLNNLFISAAATCSITEIEARLKRDLLQSKLNLAKVGVVKNKNRENIETWRLKLI